MSIFCTSHPSNCKMSVLTSTLRTLSRTFTTTCSNLSTPHLSSTLPLPKLREVPRPIGSGHVHLDLSHSPGVAIIRLDHATTHNALSARMMAELADVVDELERRAADPEDATLVTILT